MYYIKINNALYKLKTHSVPIHFIYDIGVHNDSRGSITISKVILNDDIGDVLSVDLLICDSVYKLGKPLSVHRKHNLYTMCFEVENIFESYKEFISCFDSNRFSSILTSFSTVDLCNLKCYYCSNSMNKHQDSRHHDLYLSQIFITKIHKIVKSILDDKFCAKYHCYMGGEPFIDKDMFFEYVKFFSQNTRFNSGDKVTTFQTYTNGTIPNSINDIFNRLVDSGLYKKHELWVSIDSINYKTSNRLTTEKHQDDFINNLKSIPHQNNIDVCFNIMYINDDVFKDTIKYIKGLGFNKYKVSFDDENDSELYNDWRVSKRNELLQLDCVTDMELMKEHNYYMIPVAFNIKELGKTVCRLSIAYKSDENIVRIYK